MPRVTKRYDLTYSQEKVIVLFLRGEITGAVATQQLGLGNRQLFINMLASVVQQWVADGKIQVNLKLRSDK